MSADVRTRAVELLTRLRGHGASLVVQLEPKDCAAAAGVLEALLLQHADLVTALEKVARVDPKSTIWKSSSPPLHEECWHAKTFAREALEKVK